ncbi:hypothetical protein WNY37_16390 [Henriciella sp. AS95]|uniref:hypothetical protein n=1 Tax=Henriciella sp. AS95 TaxID=3135782 RepID=UPI003175895C
MKLKSYTALAVLGLSAAMTAQAGTYEDSVQCVGAIKTITGGWPAEHPSKAQADAVASGWTDYATAWSGNTPEKVQADIAASVQEIQTYAISVKGDQAKMQAYLGPMSARCQTVPEMPVSRGVCKSLSDGEIASSDMAYNLNAYNMGFQSGDELTATQKAMAAAEERRAQAEAASTYYANAPGATSEDLLSLLEATAEERTAMFDQCVEQME